MREPMIYSIAQEKKHAWPWLIVSILVILLDQFTKFVFSHVLFLNEPVMLLPILNFTLQHNPGAAFSFLMGVKWAAYFLAAISILVSIAILIWLFRTNRSEWLLCLGLSLILGGAIGNLIDRIRLNFVIDFVDFHLGSWHFATFNVADSAISIGALLLIINFLMSKKL